MLFCLFSCSSFCCELSFCWGSFLSWPLCNLAWSSCIFSLVCVACSAVRLQAVLLQAVAVGFLVCLQSVVQASCFTWSRFTSPFPSSRSCWVTWLKLSRSNTKSPSDAKLVIMCVFVASSGSFVTHSSMASKAICHEEADSEPKLLTIGGPPEESSQLAFLPIPPKLLLLFPRLLLEAKLGYLTRSPQKGAWSWAQLGCVAGLEINLAGARWGSNSATMVLLVVPKLTPYLKLLDAHTACKRQKLCYHAELGGKASFSGSSGRNGLSQLAKPSVKLVSW